MQCYIASRKRRASNQSLAPTEKASKPAQERNPKYNATRFRYPFSPKGKRLYNHVMHKLEPLSAQVLTSRPELRLPWTEVINPFRRQLPDTLYANNGFLQSSAGYLSGSKLVLPEMNDWSLGMKTTSFFKCPSQSSLDSSRPVLAQVHTVLLVIDNESMRPHGTADSGCGSHCCRDQARSDLASTVAWYDALGTAMHFLNPYNELEITCSTRACRPADGSKHLLETQTSWFRSGWQKGMHISECLPGCSMLQQQPKAP